MKLFYLFLLVSFGYLIINSDIFNLLLISSWYKLIIIFSLVILILKILFKIKFKSWVKVIYFILFLPLIIAPIFRCWFRIPYIFCSVCPNKCVFGRVRTLFIPLILGINLKNKLWCCYCPFGQIQDQQIKISKKRFTVHLSYLRYIILFILIIILLIIFVTKKTYLLKGYGFSLTIFIIFLFLLSLSFFVPRFFCKNLCPINTSTEIILEFKKLKS